jgi:hypothetical protein
MRRARRRVASSALATSSSQYTCSPVSGWRTGWPPGPVTGVRWPRCTQERMVSGSTPISSAAWRVVTGSDAAPMAALRRGCENPRGGDRFGGLWAHVFWKQATLRTVRGSSYTAG